MSNLFNLQSSVEKSGQRYSSSQNSNADGLQEGIETGNLFQMPDSAIDPIVLADQLQAVNLAPPARSFDMPQSVVSSTATFTTTVTPSLMSFTSTPVPTIKSTATALPSWVSTLSTASIAADMAAADVNGTVTYVGLETLIADIDNKLSASNTSLTAGQLSDLKIIAANLNNGMTTSSYLTGVMNALVNGNAANAKWTGGTASSSALGNLAAGCSATQLAELNGKWFLGTDLPSSSVSMSGSSFSVAYKANLNPLFGAAGPSINDVNQGYLGDCYLLSSLGEVAKQNASYISSMFTSNGNNTYGVRFYVNGVATYVTVNNFLTNTFNSGADIWASLAEKAYAQLQASGVITGNTINSGNSWTTIGNGGAPEFALEEITGASAITDFWGSGSTVSTAVYNSSLVNTKYSTGSSVASILNILASDLAKGDDVILTSLTDAKDSAGKITLVSDHAMSIYGYDSLTNMLEVRNPWGSMIGQTWDTTFEVSLATLLADGDVITVDNIGQNNASVLAAPVLSAQTATQTWKLGNAVNFTLPLTTFTDPQAQKLTYSATLANGTALPTWLSFNASTGTFSGTVPNTVNGLSIKVTATDTSGLSASETFSVLTPAAAPVLSTQTATQIWGLGKTVSFALPSTTFTDPQAEKLTYTATLSNGAALPTWLSFNASTGTFSGTVPNTVNGLNLKVTATDTSGLSASETFSVLTPAAAPVLSAQTATQTWARGKSVNFALSPSTFTDPQAEKLTYTATLSNGAALPTWLSFNAVTELFSGIVPTNAANLSLKVTATDTSGLSTSETFSVLTPAAAFTLFSPALPSGTANLNIPASTQFTPTLASSFH
eukprot:gene7662-7723_t